MPRDNKKNFNIPSSLYRLLNPKVKSPEPVYDLSLGKLMFTMVFA